MNDEMCGRVFTLLMVAGFITSCASNYGYRNTYDCNQWHGCRFIIDMHVDFVNAYYKYDKGMAIEDEKIIELARHLAQKDNICPNGIMKVSERPTRFENGRDISVAVFCKNHP